MNFVALFLLRLSSCCLRPAGGSSGPRFILGMIAKFHRQRLLDKQDAEEKKQDPGIFGPRLITAIGSGRRWKRSVHEPLPPLDKGLAFLRRQRQLAFLSFLGRP